MTSRQREKGNRWERACVAFLNAVGFPHVERAYGAGRPDDVGDLDGIPWLTIECKDHQRLEFGPWLDEVEIERATAARRWGVVFAKRKGKPVNQGFAIMTIETFAELAKEVDQRSARASCTSCPTSPSTSASCPLVTKGRTKR